MVQTVAPPQNAKGLNFVHYGLLILQFQVETGRTLALSRDAARLAAMLYLRLIGSYLFSSVSLRQSFVNVDRMERTTHSRHC